MKRRSHLLHLPPPDTASSSSRCLRPRVSTGGSALRCVLQEDAQGRCAHAGAPLGSFASCTASLGNASRRLDATPLSGSMLGGGGLGSVLESTVSPAFSTTIIIVITVIVSGSGYLCFLKYVCSSCCGITQVAPNHLLEPSKAEEQV